MGVREVGMCYSLIKGKNYILCPKCKRKHLVKKMFVGQVFTCKCGCEFIEHLRHNAPREA
jgi:hypothetical protein